MGLFSRLFNRKKKPPMLERLVFAAAGGAANAFFNSDMMKNAASTPSPVAQVKPLNKISEYDKQKAEAEAKRLEEERARKVNAVIAELALCYYIAGIDGTVTQDEYNELHKIRDTFNSMKDVKQEERLLMGKVCNPNISFVELCTYFDKLESSSLISYALEIEKVAETGDGITAREADAIQMYKDYVTNRTGYVFAKTVQKEAKEIELVCPKCGGELELDTRLLGATCRFCGYSKILDANRIDEALTRQMATERIKALIEEEKAKGNS